MQVTFGPWASFALVFFVVLFAIITVVLLGVLAFAITKIQQQITKLTDKVEPVVVKASSTLDTVQRVTASVGEKADTILARGESLTENVSQNVEKTAAVVQSAVTTPLINLSSLITGVSKGFSVWGQAATHGGHANGREDAGSKKS
jgi:uncharacterized protein YoxC